jgi:hypothetical protein
MQPFKRDLIIALRLLLRAGDSTGAPSHRTRKTWPSISAAIDSASPSFHVSSGLLESNGQPFESTQRNQAPALREVASAVMTSVV